MLKNWFLIFVILLNFNLAVARTNSEIGKELYSVANKVKKTNPTKADFMKSNIASFLIDANMLNFSESTAKWQILTSGWLYDANSIQHIYLRHIGVYKSRDGNVMGIFDITCEDINDVQEQHYGTLKTTEVYFSPTYTPQRGRSKGFMKTFCK